MTTKDTWQVFHHVSGTQPLEGFNDSYIHILGFNSVYVFCAEGLKVWAYIVRIFISLQIGNYAGYIWGSQIPQCLAAPSVAFSACFLLTDEIIWNVIPESPQVLKKGDWKQYAFTEGSGLWLWSPTCLMKPLSWPSGHVARTCYTLRDWSDSCYKCRIPIDCNGSSACEAVAELTSSFCQCVTGENLSFLVARGVYEWTYCSVSYVLGPDPAM